MKLLLAGGGSGGPVTPVLAVAEEIKKLKPKTEFLFVGTKRGPEEMMVSDFGIRFRAIYAAKWRRYFSFSNFFAPFVFIYSLFSARSVIKDFDPDAIFSAGGFVAVPLCWVGRLLGVKIFMHQQDARIGLANKLIAPFAYKITTAFEFTSKSFYTGSGLFTKKWKARAEWTGNPIRSQIRDEGNSKSELIILNSNFPVLLILGGATGSAEINNVLDKALENLIKSYQVVHVTGQNRKRIKFDHSNYHQFDLLPFNDYAYILRKADIVLSRAGLSTITELSALGKVSIIVPMPDSHQEDNAALLHFMQAAVVMDKHNFTLENLTKVINKLTFDPDKQKLLSKNISRLMPLGSTEKIAKNIINTVTKS